MTDASRRYVMARRSGGGNNLATTSVAAGGLTYADALTEGVWKIDSVQQIGIATANEVGLSSDRFPIRVMIGNPPGANQATRVTTAVSYWRLCTHDLTEVVFSQRPIADTTTLESLYGRFPEIDEQIWAYIKAPVAVPRGRTLNQAVTTASTALYAQLAVPHPTDVQLQTARTAMETLLTAATQANVYPYLQISPDHTIHFLPHGYVPAARETIPAAHVPTAELYLNMKVNFDNLRTRYNEEAVPEGTVATAAAAIAAMFRYGLFECYTSQEYYTMYVQPVANQVGQFSVTAVVGPNNSPGPAHLIVGSVINISAFHIARDLLEVGPGFCLAAGLNHYMHNHTTGGTIASGALLSLMVMFNLISNDTPRPEQELVTSLFYEALHPVNKRGIANLFFKKSRVTTHGRPTNAMRYEQFSTDQFMKIRLQPQPAGAHKAYVCAAGLRRIVAGGLSMFLEWNSQINEVVEICRTVLHGGAEAHMGSYYYTGRAGVSQSSNLDRFMPEIAAYMLMLCKNDTLNYSAHLSPDIAAKASLNWTQLMKALRGEDYSATDAETVKRFLQSQGKVFHTFDITREETWAEAAIAGRAALDALDGLMN